MGRHTAHGYLVDNVYKSAEEFTRLFGCEPARIDETFAGFPLEGKVEFFYGSGSTLKTTQGKL